MPNLVEAEKLDREERIIVSGLLILTLFLSTIPLTSASENKFERDYVTYETTGNYSPGDFNLNISDNDSSDGSDSGYLSRDWVENTYENVMIENFLATRQVLDHYYYEPSYRTHVNWSGLSSVNKLTLSWNELYKHEKPYGYYHSWRINWWLNYLVEHKNEQWLTEELEPNSFEEWPYGWQVFQGFTDWRKKVITADVPGNNYEAWIWIPYQKIFIYEMGRYKIPVYREEEYTRWRTTIYEIRDWIPENWPAINAQITLTGIDGYEEDVQLTITIDNELLNANVENKVVHVASSATTNLTIKPQRELSGSIHQITVTAQDDYGRTKTATYSLYLQTSEKPTVENTILSIEESDTKPSDPTKTPIYIYGSRLGVEGSVYDAEEREKGVSDGLEVTVDGHSADKVWGNNYRHITIVDDPYFDGHTFIITADATDYNYQTVTAFDYEGDYKLAHKNIYLTPYSP